MGIFSFLYKGYNLSIIWKLLVNFNSFLSVFISYWEQGVSGTGFTIFYSEVYLELLDEFIGIQTFLPDSKRLRTAIQWFSVFLYGFFLLFMPDLLRVCSI